LFDDVSVDVLLVLSRARRPQTRENWATRYASCCLV